MARRVDLNDVRVLLAEYVRKESRVGVFLSTYERTGQLVSTAEPGTAPLTVSSNTVVTSLNADLLDGYHASEFATAATVSTIVADVLPDILTAGSGIVISLVGDDVVIHSNGGSAISSTTDLPEGSNLYFTEERVDDRVASLLVGGSGTVISYNDTGNALTIHTSATGDHGALTGLSDDDHTQYHTDSRALTWIGTRSTTDLPEGSNLYFTDERVDDRVNSLFVAGSGVAFSYRDDLNTFTVNTQSSVSSLATGTPLTGGGPDRVIYQDTAQNIATSSSLLFDGTNLIVSQIKDSGLTSGRLPFVSTSGLLVDSSLLAAGTQTIGINARTGTSQSAGLIIANNTFSTSSLIDLYDGSVPNAQKGGEIGIAFFRPSKGAVPSSGPQFGLYTDQDTGTGSPADNVLTAWAGGEASRWTTTGQFVGTAGRTPVSRLEVDGTVTSSGIVMLPPAPVVSGYVLTTRDENGTAYWSPTIITAGSPFSGGGANRVLFQDASQNIATSSSFTFDGNELIIPEFLSGSGQIGTSTFAATVSAPFRGLAVEGQVSPSGIVFGSRGAGSATTPAIYWNTGFGTAGFYQRTGNITGFATSGTERMNFSASGIGVTGDVTASSKLIAGNTSGTVIGENISSQSTSGTNITAGFYSNSTSGPNFHFIKSRGSSVNTTGAAQVGDVNWRITGNAYGFTAGVVLGTANRIASQIQKISAGLRPLADLRLEYPIEATASSLGTGFYLSCSGWAGVLTEQPRSEFDVNGRTTSNVFISPSGLMINGPAAWAPTSPKLSVYSSDTAVGGIGINEYVQYTPGLPNQTDVFASLYSTVQLPSTTTLSTTGHAIGILGRGTDVAGTRYGMIGVEGRVDTNVGLAANQYVGTYGFSQGIGDIASSGILIGVYARAEDRATDAGSAVNRRFVRALEVAPTVGGVSGGRYEIYQSGSNGLNYFNASTGFGTSAANAFARVTVLQPGGGGIVGAIGLLSGGASDYVYQSFGRTGPEFYIATVAATDQFMTGTIAGDTIVATASAANRLHISSGINAVPEIRVADSDIRISASGVVTGNLATGGTLATSPVLGGGVGKWKLGTAEAGAGLSLVTNNSIQVEVDGVKYRLALVA